MRFDRPSWFDGGKQQLFHSGMCLNCLPGPQVNRRVGYRHWKKRNLSKFCTIFRKSKYFMNNIVEENVTRLPMFTLFTLTPPQTERWRAACVNFFQTPQLIRTRRISTQRTGARCVTFSLISCAVTMLLLALRLQWIFWLGATAWVNQQQWCVALGVF